MGTTEIGALIVSLRSESAAFRAEMDKGRDSIQNVGTHAGHASRNVARFAAIAAEQLVPGLQGSRLAMEGFVQTASRATGVLGQLARAGAVVGTFGLGVALGNAIRNFIELRQQGQGWLDSLNLAIGRTKSYEQSVKDAGEEQKKFSAAMAANRAVVQGIDKEIATLTDDYRKLAEIAEVERRARIQTLPIAEREAAQRKSAAITQLQLLEAVGRKEQEIRDARTKQGEQDVQAATALKLSPGSLIFGLKDIADFQKNVDDLGKAITTLAAKGTPAVDMFKQIDEAQAAIDKGIDDLREKFTGVAAIQNRLDDLQRSVGGGEFRRGLDETLRGIQKLAPGAAKVEDEFGNLIQTAGQIKQGFGDATDAANNLAVVMGNIPQAVGPLESGFVVVTGRLRDLAEAFHAAANEALFFETVVGDTANIAVAAPGNF